MSILTSLREHVGTAHVLTEPSDVAPYVEDWRGRYRGEVMAVLQPATTQQVSAVVQICAQAGVKLIP